MRGMTHTDTTCDPGTALKKNASSLARSTRVGVLSSTAERILFPGDESGQCKPFGRRQSFKNPKHVNPSSSEIVMFFWAESEHVRCIGWQALVR